MFTRRPGRLFSRRVLIDEASGHDTAIEFYDGGGRPNPNLDVDVRPLRLNEAERAALVAFLEALSGTTFDDDALTPTRRSEPDSSAR